VFHARILDLSGLAAVVVAFMALPAGASGAVTAVFAGQTISGQPVPCATQSTGVRMCAGDYSSSGGPDLRLKSFDGTALQFWLTLPPAPASGVDGDYPLVVQSHGWAVPTTGPTDTQYGGPTGEEWAQDGYAVLQFNARGWADSCGTVQSQLVNESACTNGYIHLDDYRYEARDVQYAVGLLVDDGLVNPNEIGVTGESYGAGVSLELATLNNRVMLPDGQLVPWTSPDGTPLHIAAAAPYAGYSDLVYALVPNGRTLDDQITSPTADFSPIGVEKLTFDAGLYATGAGDADANYAPPVLEPTDNLTTWFAALSAGDPYDTSFDESIAQQVAEYHSPYYLLQGDYGFSTEAPAPIFWANGFTDAVFPADEALRYHNLERSRYPSDPISLFFGDIGHQPANDKPADLALMRSRILAFFNYYVKGTGPQPTLGVTALTQTCPKTVASGGPYWAPTWAGLHPGEVDYASNPTQAILSSGGNPEVAAIFDPILSTQANLGGICQTASATPEPGVATYRLPAATGAGYTLLGAPTVIANFQVTGAYAYVAARLLDVDPATNTETLVARGDYRFDPNAPDGVQIFQLHPGAWHFAAGHIPELELLGRDAPYLHPSNGAFTVDVSDLQLRLPVYQTPGAPGTPTVVHKPLPPFNPACPPPTGELRSSEIGKLRLLMTRVQARHAYEQNSTRGTRYEEFFCLAGSGIRVGYASPKLLSTLPRSSRHRFAGRVVWISTANRHYQIHGIRPGASLFSARQQLKLEGPFHVGLNDWYIAPNDTSAAILKVRHQLVEEIGIAVRALTDSRAAARRFLTSFS